MYLRRIWEGSNLKNEIKSSLHQQSPAQHFASFQCLWFQSKESLATPEECVWVQDWARRDVYSNHQELLTINIKPLAQLLAVRNALSVAPHPKKKEPGRWSSCRIWVGCFRPFPKCLFVGYFNITTKVTIKQIKSKAVSLLFITQPKQIPPPAGCIQQLAFVKCWWQRCLYQLCDASDCRCELEHQQRHFLQAAFHYFFLKDVASF